MAVLLQCTQCRAALEDICFCMPTTVFKLPPVGNSWPQPESRLFPSRLPLCRMDSLKKWGVPPCQRSLGGTCKACFNQSVSLYHSHSAARPVWLPGFWWIMDRRQLLQEKGRYWGFSILFWFYHIYSKGIWSWMHGDPPLKNIFTHTYTLTLYWI